MPLRLTLSDGEHTVTAEGEIPQAAQNKPITAERIKAAVDKFGSTPYLRKDRCHLRGRAVHTRRRN
ncbi:MAG: DUF3656 domain-containing U32 family peptidase [Oscillospiraceae bacterium]